jgi:hypothetical protein
MADILLVVVAFNLVTFLRGVSTEVFILPLVGPAIVFVLALHLIDGYGASSDMMSLDYASLHVIASVSAALLTLFLTYAFIPAGFELQSSRAAIILSFGLVGPVSLAYRRYYYSRSLVRRGERKIVFLGEKGDFDVFSSECTRMGTQASLVHVDSREGYQAFEQVLGSIEAATFQVEAIVVKESGENVPADVPMRLVQLYFSGIPTYTLEIFHQVYWRKIPLYRINPIWLFQEGFRIAREPIFERLKRISDVAFSVVGLVFSIPVICAAAAAIKLDDGGPVFFLQNRVGWRKRTFKLIKLRTMRATQGTRRQDPSFHPLRRAAPAMERAGGPDEPHRAAGRVGPPGGRIREADSKLPLPAPGEAGDYGLGAGQLPVRRRHSGHAQEA